MLIHALESGLLGAVRRVPKSDLHNHCLLGGSRRRLQAFSGQKFPAFRAGRGGISDLNHWITTVFRPFVLRPGAFEVAVEAAFLQAIHDGVTVLEMSIDAMIPDLLQVTPEKMVDALQKTHNRVAPGIEFRPELGFSRAMEAGVLLPRLERFLALGYFSSIDMYDDELAQPAENFRSLFAMARSAGLRCKAHAGEFGDARSVRHAVETLHLDAVQHGIAAANSPEVMRWLANHAITLNVCPASNIRLRRAASYKTHPIRILLDHGVRVTVNTDDALIFGVGVSEQFMRLYRSGCLTAAELEMIRLNGLSEQNRICTI